MFDRIVGLKSWDIADSSSGYGTCAFRDYNESAGPCIVLMSVVRGFDLNFLCAQRGSDVARFWWIEKIK